MSRFNPFKTLGNALAHRGACQPRSRTMHLRNILSLLLLLPVWPGCVTTAAAASPQQAARDLAAFLDGIPELGPGYAVVIVDRDQQLLGYTRGVRNASSPGAADHAHADVHRVADQVLHGVAGAGAGSARRAAPGQYPGRSLAAAAPS
ncbi:hypothetical protein [Stenotrophomonas sp.]|uniref:hypothetical protein n=1 Tax=Stenotrophomonas sp. TaxID=69392 RepID=UPI00289B5318|nr:hypothetical protein [Stenotrophomonas sp.]